LQKSDLYKNIIYLWKYLGRGRKFKFLLLFLLIIFSVFVDIISIGSIIPFLTVLSHPEKIMNIEYVQPILKILNIKSSEELLLPITIGFIMIAIFSMSIRILLLRFNSLLAADMGIELRKKIYKKILYQPYVFHIMNNSSELISINTEKVNIAIQAGIMHVLMMLSAFLTVLAVITTLLLVNPLVAILTFVILGGGYIFIGFFSKKYIQKNGYIISKNQPLAIKCMQEGLGGIRDIILNNNQSIFINIYSDVVQRIQYARMKNIFLGSLPKSFLEMLAMILIATLAYFLFNTNNKESIISILGVLALGAQKLLPSLQQIYYSWSFINSYESILNTIVEYLKKTTPYSAILKDNNIDFNKSIELRNVFFKYPKTNRNILKEINLKILKGMKVGFVGTTGSGKSTLLDIIMGLLKPTSGEILVDDVKIDNTNIKSWQKNIAHVPQNIFLTDTTIAENIAFGLPLKKINMEKLNEVIEQASLREYIESLPNGFFTKVGERGIKLSGGQRQRIGIARALYKEANVIIFDEATSALDNETEKNVMNAINLLRGNLTILIIAHRLSTLEECDVIYKIDRKGNINIFK